MVVTVLNPYCLGLADWHCVLFYFVLICLTFKILNSDVHTYIITVSNAHVYLLQVLHQTKDKVIYLFILFSFYISKWPKIPALMLNVISSIAEAFDVKSML